MTPILALSLGVVLGDVRLLGRSCGFFVIELSS